MLFLGSSRILQNDDEDTRKTSGTLRSNAAMAIKGVTVRTKKIMWVPGEATATSLSQCSLNFANLVGAGLVRSIFKFPFESDTHFSESQSIHSRYVGM